MLTQVGKSLFLGLAIVGMGLMSSARADEVAKNEPNPSNSEQSEKISQSLSQLRSIRQLQDVDPSNWSYQALRNLVEKYGCIVGYPDGTYRGDRALSRYEFAAGLNACIEALERQMLSLKDTQPSTVSQAQPTVSNQVELTQESIPSMFNRAFFNDTGTFIDRYNIPGQLNAWLGWRTFPGSFVENSIAREGKLLSTLYNDVMGQQMGNTVVRTTDLPNPFTTSILESPSYSSPNTINPTSSRANPFNP